MQGRFFGALQPQPQCSVLNKLGMLQNKQTNTKILTTVQVPACHQNFPAGIYSIWYVRVLVCTDNVNVNPIECYTTEQSGSPIVLIHMG